MLRHVMQLHVYEWGDASAPPLICLHGVTAFGARFTQLAEERWAHRFHVLAPDLRGHGYSGWEAPWTFETYVDDLVETFGGVGPATWLGHSFGGRLVLELAHRCPELVERAVLLDPAIHVLPHVAAAAAELERADAVFDSVEAYVDSRPDSGDMDRDRAIRDMTLHLEPLPDGRVRRRNSQAAAVSIYGELATEPPPPPAVPTLLLYAPDYGLVRDEHVAQYEHVVRVPGLHMVMWSAFDETADAVDAFLR
ncbi:MAG: alpha/beta fold hydrolase [Actinomycetota bacterium]